MSPIFRTVLALIIINKAGGLIYSRHFSEGLNQLDTNDYLVLAGTFHGVHAITARLNPLKDNHHYPHHSSISATASTTQQQHGQPASPAEPPNRHEALSGLEVMETENFRLQCFNTQTGTKFLLFTASMQQNVDMAMGKVYELYADYVMKNPFYQLEMPIRCELFDRKLSSYIREINNAR